MRLQQYTKGLDVVDDPPGLFKNVEIINRIIGGIKLQSTDFWAHKLKFYSIQTMTVLFPLTTWLRSLPHKEAVSITTILHK